jgi:hypothetical protein
MPFPPFLGRTCLPIVTVVQEVEGRRQDHPPRTGRRRYADRKSYALFCPISQLSI